MKSNPQRRKKTPAKLNLLRKFLPSLIIIGFFVVPELSFAQSACTDQIGGKSRAQLEQELAACDAEIAQLTAELNKARATSASFQGDIKILEEKIRIAQTNIRNKNNQIRLLTKDIAIKQSQILSLEERLARGKKALGDILKKTNDITSYSLVEAMLSEKNLSEFFVDIDTYASAERALSELFDELREVKSLTEAEKTALNKKREQEAAAKAALENSKKQVELDQKEKERLLTISKNNEKTYAQEVADRQAKAAQIRATLFPLRDSVAIPFGTALQYAQDASQKTGVRPALILAILQQESNLGANVGSCVITDLQSGQTKGVNTGTIFKNGIHPTRDLPILQEILPKIGRDPLSTKVSCPIANVAGYGGAMGPSQFIPSTWKIMEGKIASALGKTTPDPWNPQDAIMATALYLKDGIDHVNRLGDYDQYTTERGAACIYYSGRICSAGPGLPYGTSVMKRVADIQRDIDFLRGL